jgi:hypothetical protein
MIGRDAGGQPAAVLDTRLATCKHLAIDPFAYRCVALPGLFALGQKPTVERLLEGLPDRWLLRRSRGPPRFPARAG